MWNRIKRGRFKREALFAALGFILSSFGDRTATADNGGTSGRVVVMRFGCRSTAVERLTLLAKLSVDSLTRLESTAES